MSADHDAFFDDLYVRTTEPFLTEAMTRAEVKAFVSLAPLPPGSRVLDLGCGWGRHGPALEAHGLKVYGVERASRPAHRAGQQGLVVARADVRRLPWRAEAFEAVACFYSSLFFFDEAQNLDSLREVKRVLAPGGALVLQAANPLHLARLGEEERSWPLPTGERIWERTRFEVSTGTEVGERRLTLPDGEVREGGYRIRHYAPGELEVLALRAGLKLVDVRGDLSLSPWTRQSREVVALFRA